VSPIWSERKLSCPDIVDRGSLRARRPLGGATVTGPHPDRRRGWLCDFQSSQTPRRSKGVSSSWSPREAGSLVALWFLQGLGGAGAAPVHLGLFCSGARHKACYGAEPMVRIYLPPASSPVRTLLSAAARTSGTRDNRRARRLAKIESRCRRATERRPVFPIASKIDEVCDPPPRARRNRGSATHQTGGRAANVRGRDDPLRRQLGSGCKAELEQPTTLRRVRLARIRGWRSQVWRRTCRT
jgi:hypothetical protein